MNITILENKESIRLQAKHIYKSKSENEEVKFYVLRKSFKHSDPYVTKLDFQEGLKIAYAYVLNQMPMGKRIDVQMKYKNASDEIKINLILDNIRMNNLYNKMILEVTK